MILINIHTHSIENLVIIKLYDDKYTLKYNPYLIPV